MTRPTRTRSARRATLASVATAGALILSGCAPAEETPILTWYTNPDDGGQAAIAEQCTAAADGRYTIETSMLPTDAASQREQLTRRLAAGDTSMDIMSLDPPFIPELAEPGFLAPVPEDVQAESEAHTLEGALAGAKWKDTMVAVPFWANTQLLWYRKSVAEAAGLDMSRPVTWDQLIEAARTTDTQLGVQGARAESMTVWLNAMVEGGGEHIITDPAAPADEVQTSLDSDAGRKAAEIIGTIGSEGLGSAGLPTQDENASMLLFQGEKGSFMVNWPFVWPATLKSAEGGTLPADLPSDIGWTTYPRTFEDQEAAPPLGGINLGVGAKSTHVDLAYDAISCITSQEHQSQYFVENGNPPANPASYDAAAVTEKYPMAPVIRDSLDKAAPRPQTPYYNEVSTAVQQNFTPPSAVSPDSTPAATDQFIQEVLRGERLL